MKVRFYFFIIAFLIFPSCSAILGVHKTKILNDELIKKKADNIYSNSDNLYKIDTTFFIYVRMLPSMQIQDTSFNDCSFQNNIQKDLSQPIMAIYFNKEGDMVSFFTNCYAGGFPYLKWNRHNNFDSFPPKTLAPIYNEIKLSDISQYFKKLDIDSNILYRSFEDYDYIVVVVWNNFIRRQGKRLIKYVNNNCLNQNALVIYVNNDNLWHTIL